MRPSVINTPAVETQIHTVRGLSVMLDADLADLYGVTPGALMQAVRRNSERFPEDFVFQLINQEVTVLKSQIVISKPEDGRGGRRSRPYAFTEQGVAMLSSVLRSSRAVQVNIEIMRAFVRLRRAAIISNELMKLVDDLSVKVESHDQAIGELVAAIRQMMTAPAEPERRRIGFT
jgi:ORF6N domain